MIPQSKEQAILKAAEKEFIEKGCDGAKTTSIAAAAGVTHAMLHYYFRTKENIFNKVFEDKIAIMGQSILDSFANPELPFVERTKIGVGAHFDFLVANPDLPRFVVNELVSKPERNEIIKEKISSLAGNVMKNLQREIDIEHKKGNIEPISVIDLMIDIVSLNIFVFLAYPILESFAVEPFGGRDQFLQARRKENIEVIMRRIVKQ